MKNENKKANKLINEDSPYLLQHAYNPVSWEAWSEESLLSAKEQKKLIFLSIGYSTCHWCHVMEEESFEDEDVAIILNKYYVSIKVDREEMPHLDKYFQEVHNFLNKRAGGWPLSVVLTPDAKPLFVATYIPKEPRYGMSGFKELLLHIKGLWDKDEQKLTQSSLQIEQVLKEYKTNLSQNRTPLDIQVVENFVQEVEENFDTNYFGIGSAPKFPHASSIETLLEIYLLQKNTKAFSMATDMLEAMAKGGINDQIEGGFYRYSVDEAWQVPHFEKMLYTNAELLSAYSKASLITKKPLFKNVVKSIIDFAQERFEKEGLFYAASDADSLDGKEKKEGAYFVFSYKETFDFLSKEGFEKEEIKEALAYFNISKKGNFEESTTNPYLSEMKTPKKLTDIKKALKTLRQTRPYPFVDKKVLTSWNALFITSLFHASKVDNSYEKKALHHLETLLEALHVKGVLYHQRLVEKPPKVNSLLEDYAFLIEALLYGYEARLDDKFLIQARKLCDEAIERFYRQKNWFMSDDDFQTHETFYDSSYKSPLATMADNLLKIAIYTDELSYQEIAQEIFHNSSMLMTKTPSNTPKLVSSFLKSTLGYVILKSNKKNLENKPLPIHGLVLRKIVNQEEYVACSIDACFAHEKSFDLVFVNILKRFS